MDLEDPVALVDCTANQWQAAEQDQDQGSASVSCLWKSYDCPSILRQYQSCCLDKSNLMPGHQVAESASYLLTASFESLASFESRNIGFCDFNGFASARILPVAGVAYTSFERAEADQLYFIFVGNRFFLPYR